MLILNFGFAKILSFLLIIVGPPSTLILSIMTSLLFMSILSSAVIVL